MNEEKINIRVLTPFGPGIAKTKIPTPIITKLNEYFDKINSNTSKTSELNHGNKLVGNVSKELKIEHQFAKECGWTYFLSKITEIYIKALTEKNIKKFSIIETWIVSQFEHEYNPTHWHSGHISGAGYLKIPNTMGSNFQKKNMYNYNGHLQLIHGTRQFLSHSLFNIKPELGDFYLFPNYLMHTVFPFRETKEERRCISFNALIDEEIYNVY